MKEFHNPSILDKIAGQFLVVCSVLARFDCSNELLLFFTFSLLFPLPGLYSIDQTASNYPPELFDPDVPKEDLYEGEQCFKCEQMNVLEIACSFAVLLAALLPHSTCALQRALTDVIRAYSVGGGAAAL